MPPSVEDEHGTRARCGQKRTFADAVGVVDQHRVVLVWRALIDDNAGRLPSDLMHGTDNAVVYQALPLVAQSEIVIAPEIDPHVAGPAAVPLGMRIFMRGRHRLRKCRVDTRKCRRPDILATDGRRAAGAEQQGAHAQRR